MAITPLAAAMLLITQKFSNGYPGNQWNPLRGSMTISLPHGAKRFPEAKI
jgi:hypothetical protein